MITSGTIYFRIPRLISLTDITERFMLAMNSEGVSEVHDYTKKNLRRKLENDFIHSLTFFTVNRRIYVMPDNLKKEVLTAECVLLSSKMDSIEKANRDSASIIKAAVTLREEIKSIPCRDNWSPRPEELNPGYVSIPPSLQKFLHVLLGGTEVGSPRISRLAWSMAQDIITAISVGAVKHQNKKSINLSMF